MLQAAVIVLATGPVRNLSCVFKALAYCRLPSSVMWFAPTQPLLRVSTGPFFEVYAHHGVGRRCRGPRASAFRQCHQIVLLACLVSLLALWAFRLSSSHGHTVQADADTSLGSCGFDFFRSLFHNSLRKFAPLCRHMWW